MKAPDPSEKDLQIPDLLPVIPLRDITVYPYIITPLSIGRETSLAAVDAALSTHRLVVLVGQLDPSQEEAAKESLHSVGTVATIMRMLKLPDGRVRVLVQGIARCRLEYFTEDKNFFEAKVSTLPEVDADLPSIEVEALIRNVKGLLERITSLGKPLSSEVLVIANSMEHPGRLADLVASNIDLKPNEAQQILQELHATNRLRLVYDFLAREVALLEMQQQINTQARGEMDRTQRDFYLRQQLKIIQGELGEGNELQEEIQAYREKLAQLELSEEARKEVEKQLRRLEHMHPDTAETGLIRTYLDWMTEIPWGKKSADDIVLSRAQKVLHEDHYGLEEIKERILEFLSVRKLNPAMKNPILCFVGPPGVGKTSLGRSIARALGRKFVRLSLGGLRDEAEIRGHRKTYVGALPGRIVQGLCQAGTMNPVFVMDEVDKIGQDFRGDPSAALLEVLDPEQNHAFRDHYLGVSVDLTGVMFILTANTLDTIQPAFRDRMEIIELSSYTQREKVEIAMRHLVPRQIAEHGLTREDLSLTRKTISSLTERYTREAGLRQLERLIGKLCRKIARRKAEEKTYDRKVGSSALEEWLGPPKIIPDQRLQHPQIGIAAGLAWTAVGGELLFVEGSLMNGKGNLLLTGHLGEVMKESAQIALSLIRSRAEDYAIPATLFSERDIHIHFPEGATPKDGPSAGITIAVVLLSLLTRRPIRCDVAMTGELTLRGEVLPIGGLKEKALAAERAGIPQILFPKANEPDLREIPKEVREACTFHPVRQITQVFAHALLDAPSAG